MNARFAVGNDVQQRDRVGLVRFHKQLDHCRVNFRFTKHIAGGSPELDRAHVDNRSQCGVYRLANIHAQAAWRKSIVMAACGGQRRAAADFAGANNDVHKRASLRTGSQSECQQLDVCAGWRQHDVHIVRQRQQSAETLPDEICKFIGGGARIGRSTDDAMSLLRSRETPL
jgi:hypothetical protein